MPESKGQEISNDLEAKALAFLRVKLHAKDVVLRHGRNEAAAVGSAGLDVLLVRAVEVITVDKIEVFS
jgi:hypothetical protein